MKNKICNNCNALNIHNAVCCVNCGNGIQYYSPVSRKKTTITPEIKQNKSAITSFVLSLTPLGSLVMFILHLTLENVVGITSGDNALLFLGVVFLMLLLGLNIYIGSYVMSILAIVLGIKGRKSEKKKFAIMGIIISIFNFPIPFLISPINELFLK